MITKRNKPTDFLSEFDMERARERSRYKKFKKEYHQIQGYMRIFERENRWLNRFKAKNKNKNKAVLRRYYRASEVMDACFWLCCFEDESIKNIRTGISILNKRTWFPILRRHLTVFWRRGWKYMTIAFIQVALEYSRAMKLLHPIRALEHWTLEARKRANRRAFRVYRKFDDTRLGILRSEYIPPKDGTPNVMFKWRHYFNDIPYTIVPFCFGWGIFLCLFFLIVCIKKSLWVMPVGLLCMLAICFLRWFCEMYVESSLRGRYGRKIRAALCCGFFLFLVSEVMLFGGFFWAYFDRFFNPGYVFDGSWIPAGIDVIEFSRWPFVGTIILITSGYFANHSYYLLKSGDFLLHLLYGYCAIVLAISFLCIQLFEYNESLFTISDSVYGSFFYLLTGFHGFHVTVGLIFLVEQYERTTANLAVEYPYWTLNRCNACRYSFSKRSTFFKRVIYYGTIMHRSNMHYENLPSTQCYYCDSLNNLDTMLDFDIQLYNRQRNTGLMLSIIYWHFVDIIWIFLYYFVYVQAYLYM